MQVLQNKVKWTLNDYHYIKKWDKSTLDIVRSLDKEIREANEKDKLLKEFDELQPLSVQWDYKYIATFKGIAQFCKLITGDSTDRPAVVAVGQGSTVPSAFDFQLVDELEYVEIANSGFFNASGTTIRYNGTFGQSIADEDFKESLLRNQASASGATVFCRNVFAVNFIDHNQGAAGFSCGGVFEFVPIQD